MNDLDFKRELAERRQRLIKENSRILEQIKACDALLQTLGEPREQTDMPFVRPEQPATNGKISVSDMVDAAVRTLPKELSLSDIMEFIRINHADQTPDKKTVASTFWKMAKDKDFKIIRKGGGRKPTIYSKN